MAATIMHFVSNHTTYLHYKMQVSPVHKVSSHSIGMDLEWMWNIALRLADNRCLILLDKLTLKVKFQMFRKHVF